MNNNTAVIVTQHIAPGWWRAGDFMPPAHLRAALSRQSTQTARTVVYSMPTS